MPKAPGSVIEKTNQASIIYRSLRDCRTSATPLASLVKDHTWTAPASNRVRLSGRQ